MSQNVENVDVEQVEKSTMHCNGAMLSRFLSGISKKIERESSGELNRKAQ